jgi:hypothetical protein
MTLRPERDIYRSGTGTYGNTVEVAREALIHVHRYMKEFLVDDILSQTPDGRGEQLDEYAERWFCLGTCSPSTVTSDDLLSAAQNASFDTVVRQERKGG